MNGGAAITLAINAKTASLLSLGAGTFLWA